jgi:cytochrome c-type biogenesis protein CcmH/NrfF
VRLWPAAAAAALGALVTVVALGSAPDPNSVASAEAVAGRMMSPFCPGLTLEECPSQQAAELRSQIAAKVRAGATNREIDDWIVANYGESALARPRTVMAWLAPALAAGLGLLALLSLLRRRRPPEPQGALPEISEADRAKVRQDMTEFLGGANE